MVVVTNNMMKGEGKREPNEAAREQMAMSTEAAERAAVGHSGFDAPLDAPDASDASDAYSP